MAKFSLNAMIVPTGIGACIGGYAGDASPIARKLATVSDRLIVNPNIVNAAMFSDISPNTLVVEGFLLDRFFAGQVALREGFKHNIAVIVDASANEHERELIEACVKEAREFYDIEILPRIFYTKEAIGAENLKEISNPITLLEACAEAQEAGATAFALLAVLNEDADKQASLAYSQGQGFDPIGRIEARLSHLVSQMFLLPSAHAPILRNSTPNISCIRPPKLAAEYLSECFLGSVLNCLKHSPQVLPVKDSYKLLKTDFYDANKSAQPLVSSDIKIYDLSKLIVPIDSCNGVPMIESHKHQIDLLCVEENTTNLDDRPEYFGIPHQVLATYDDVYKNLV